ncbi:hypothetical protein P8A18_13130 [Streptomyces castrisilvae]|uniref:Uncharacterized protein n=1 Tax=Streptomyces castrisilvae TaxID=3033811 RepID=A0ABY9HIZ6_9ACTN|nr:hypothetical protein [Streptomyces sp. Mut1]WLQ34324.1 hypothetical protein P8A18_13130 [Streptomyces sp. Mut1]
MTHENQHKDLLDFPGAAALERAGRTEPLDPAVQARAHSLVLGAIAADATDTQETVRAEVVKPRFGRNRMFALAAAVAAIAVGAAILPVTDIGGDGPAASASASEVFTTMANHFTIADRVNSESITEHLKGKSATAPYWKTKVTGWVEGNHASTDTIYLSRNSMTIKSEDGTTAVKKFDSEREWAVGKGWVDWDHLKNLPAEPDALRRALSAGAKGSDAAAEQTVRQAGELLISAPITNKVRAAVFRVLAKTPGATVKEGVKDAVGRSGTRITWKWDKRFTEQNPKDWGFSPATDGKNPKGYKLEPGPILRQHWIVSPSDGRILEVNHDEHDKPGHVVRRSTYLSVGPAKTTD